VCRCSTPSTFSRSDHAMEITHRRFGCSSTHLLRLFVFSLTSKHQCQIAEAVRLATRSVLAFTSIEEGPMAVRRRKQTRCWKKIVRVSRLYVYNEFRILRFWTSTGTFSSHLSFIASFNSRPDFRFYADNILIATYQIITMHFPSSTALFLNPMSLISST
jgi:hypothetical protein